MDRRSPKTSETLYLGLHLCKCNLKNCLTAVFQVGRFYPTLLTRRLLILNLSVHSVKENVEYSRQNILKCRLKDGAKLL